VPIVEGKGLVPPKPVHVAIDGSELYYLQHIASQRDKHRGYRSSSSLWRRGSTDNPILMGLVGEYAFQEYLRSRGIKTSVVDERLNNGDGGLDAMIAGVSYQIKTSGKSYPTCLIRRINESKRIVPHVCDRFVFCRWSYGDRFCDLRGWCERDVVVELGKIRRGKKGGEWFNNEIDHVHFSSIPNLAMLIKQELSDVQ
jgi:hypothetical protein